MPLPIISHVCRAAVTGACPPGGRWANVWHLNFSGGGWPTSTDIAAMEAILLRIYSGSDYTSGHPYFTFANANTTIDKITVTPLDGSAASTIFTPGVSASSGNTPLGPAEVACVLSMHTPFRGRSHRGRVYLPPVYVSQLNGGVFSTAFINYILAQVAGAQTALGGANWSIGVASYKTTAFNSATAFTIDTLPDVQRRRKF
jgi:hypothetical protein